MAFQELRGRLALDVSDFRSGISRAESGLGNLSSRAQNVGRSMQRAGRTMSMAVTAPLVGAGVASAKFAADFDQQMQRSVAVMGDVSDTMREDLEATAREVATNMAVSHEEAADSFYFLASAGFDAQESMASMADVAAFAEAGQLDMAQASDYATDILQAFNMEADELDKVVDTMTATFTAHNQTAQDMGEAMSFVAPIAAGMGVEIEEASAAIGMMGDAGIKGQRAGTSLRRAMSALAEPTGRAAERLEELGVQTTDAEGNLLSLPDIMEQFEEAGASAGDMMAIFGQRAGPAMQALLSQGSDALRESTAAIKESEGATQDIAETQRDTLNAQLDILRSNLRDAAITFGKDFLPVLNSAVQALRPAAEWFQNLNSSQRRLIVVVGAAAAALGPLLIGLGAFMTLLPGIISGLGAIGGGLALLTGPIGAVVLAIGALAAAWATDFMGIRSATTDAVDGILTALEPLLNALGPEFEATLAHWQNVIGDGLAVVESFWSEHGEAIMSVLGPLFDNIRIIVEGLLDAIITAVRVGMAILRGDFTGAFELIHEYLGRQVDRFMEAGKNLIRALINGIKALAPDVGEAIEGIVQDVRDKLPGSDAKEGPLSDLSAAGEALPDTLAQGMESGAGRVGQASDAVAGRALPSTGTAGGGSSAMRTELKALRSELKALLSGPQEIGGEVEVDMERGVIRIVDAQIKRERRARDRLGGRPGGV
jgi:TP901 family phage tail tape measure protein